MESSDFIRDLVDKPQEPPSNRPHFIHAADPNADDSKFKKNYMRIVNGQYELYHAESS